MAEAHLQAFGFDPGTVDSIFTAQTQVAVGAFQAQYGLPVSGLLDTATREELKLGGGPQAGEQGGRGVGVRLDMMAAELAEV